MPKTASNRIPIRHKFFMAANDWDLARNLLVQTLICEITELTNENHQHDCRASVSRPCPCYIVHIEAGRPAENAVGATGSNSYADPVANLYIHLDSWLHKRVNHSEQKVRLTCYSSFSRAYLMCYIIRICEYLTYNNSQPKTMNNEQGHNSSIMIKL